MPLYTLSKVSTFAQWENCGLDELRSQLVFKHKFQKTMILEVMLITFTFINIIAVAGFVLLDQIPNPGQYKGLIALVIAVFELVGFFIVYRYNLRASHRIAGPLFNLERSLELVESGNIGFNVEFREDDHFHELSEQMNKTVSSLRACIERIQSLASNLQQQPNNQQTTHDLISKINQFSTSELRLLEQNREAT